MWKITTHDFTLEEILIMVAMNLLASSDGAPKSRGARAHQMIETGHVRGKLVLKVTDLSC